MKTIKRKLMPTWATCIGAAVLAVIVASPVFASVGSSFELEGDAEDIPAGMPDDWSALNGGTGSANTFTGIKPDASGVTIFTQGGSKDEAAIGSWRHKSGTVPDKDDITNAYAANYIDPNTGHQVVYFGADRLANDGDALMGFWFFQSGVAPKLDGTFSGVHMNGDVFVIANFTGGGQVVTEQIYVWDTTCLKGVTSPGVGQCGGTNLRLKATAATASNANCMTGGSSSYCAITNTTSVPAPWSYTPKQNATNPATFPVASFMEGGLDITAIFGHSVCFASYLAETRSSSSVSAVLKDFVQGDFNVCKVAASKTCVNDDKTDDTAPIGSTPAIITYNIRGCAINDGAGTVNISSLLNSVPDGAAKTTPSGLTWFIPPAGFTPTTDCGNDVALKTVTLGTGGNPPTGTLLADPSSYDLLAGKALVYQFVESTSSGVSDTVTVNASGSAGATIDPATASAICPDRTFSANLSVDKFCQANLEDVGDKVAVKVEAKGQVCNKGEVQLTGVTVSDSPAFAVNPTVDSSTLAPGACTNWSGYYYPSSIPSGNECPFSDKATAKANAPVGITVAPVESNSATCKLRVLDDDTNCATGKLAPQLIMAFMA